MNRYTKEIKVISSAEILGLIIVFLAVLYLLYPKSMLEKQVLSESSNYDLTAIYVENMLRIDPSNRALMYTFAKTALKRGKIDLALSLSDVLLKDATKEEKTKVYQLKYKIYKQESLYATQKRKQEIVTILDGLKDKIKSFNIKSKEESKYWFHEMLWCNAYDKALSIANKVLQKEPKNIYWLSQKYELLARLHKTKRMKATLDILLSEDKVHSKYWFRQAYQLAKKENNTSKMNEYKALLEGTTVEKNLEKMVREALDEGLYLQAADLYMQGYEGSKTKKKKVQYLKDALDVLVEGSIPNERVNIIRRVENDFLDDPKMVKYFLEIYLASDKLEYAVALSKKLLKQGM